MSTVSARPEALRRFAGVQAAVAEALRWRAGRLGEALDAFRRGEGRAAFLPAVPSLDVDVAEAGRGVARLAEFVDAVASAFERADRWTGCGGVVLAAECAVQAGLSWMPLVGSTEVGRMIGELRVVLNDPTYSVVERARAVQAWARGLTDTQWDALIAAAPELVGPVGGMPFDRRYQANRVLIGRALADTRNALEQARRQGDHEAVERLTRREKTLRGFLYDAEGEPANRQFLLFDNTGDGRVAEVFGDLDDADNVALLVPGMSNHLDNFDSFADNAKQLRAAVLDYAPGSSTAVIAWLGYNTPDSADVLDPAKAEAGAPALRGFSAGLLLKDEVVTSVVAHSYGSLVTGIALRQGLQADNVAVIGSPGVGADDIEDLRLPPETDFWAARAPLDAVAWSEWHGADPTDPRFGGHRFEAGQIVWHSDYFMPGSESLRNLAFIVTDQDHLVSARRPTPLDQSLMGIDLAQERVDACVGTAQDVVDRGQDGMGDALEKVPGGRLVALPVNGAVDAAQGVTGVAVKETEKLVDKAQEGIDKIGDIVGDFRDMP
ncbi:MAG: alpha/beta hydrolase [Egibacteraceae bacterium]